MNLVKRIFIVSFVFISLVGYAQKNANIIVNDTSYTYKWVENNEEWVISSRIINKYANNKKIETNTQIWNSINSSWNYSWKTNYVYDLSGRQTQSSNYNFENDIWLKNWKNTTEYNTIGKRVSYLNEVGDSTQMNWINQSIQIFAYNQNNAEITKTTKHWDNNWVNYSKDSTVYDSSNVISKTISQDWGDNDTWQNSTQINYSLTTNPAIYITQAWDNNTNNWRNIALNSIEIGCDGHVRTGLSQSWDNNTNNWKNTSRYLNSYSGELKSIVEYQYWNNTDSLWTKNYHELYSYNNMKQFTERLRQNWDNNTQIWVNAINYTYEYNDTYKKIEDAILNWNNITNQWIGVSQNKYAYEESRLQERISQVWGSDDDWLNKTKLTYFYTDLSDIKELIENPKILISNTIKRGENILFVNTKHYSNLTIELYDMEGRLALQKHLAVNQGFNVSRNLKTGIYILRVINNNITLSSDKVFVY